MISKLEKAFIVGVQKHQYEVILENDYHFLKNEAIIFKAILKSSNFIESIDEFPVIGDYVELEILEDVHRIIRIENQFSKFSKCNANNSKEFIRMGHDKEEVLFKNADYVFIISSMNNDFNIKRLIRYVNTAKGGNIIPVIVLSKMDLTDTPDRYINEVKNTFKDIDVIPISALNNINIDELKKYFGFNKTIALIGMSGVGKSTLLNNLFNEDLMKTKSIRENDSRGRHTTTSRRMFILEDGTKIIDMPGIRSIENFNEGSVFDAIEELSSQCKFKNCKHDTEPFCAIKKAIDDGVITKEEFNNYIYSKKLNNFVQKKKKFKEKVLENKKEIFNKNKKKRKDNKFK